MTSSGISKCQFYILIPSSLIPRLTKERFGYHPCNGWHRSFYFFGFARQGFIRYRGSNQIPRFTKEGFGYHPCNGWNPVAQYQKNKMTYAIYIYLTLSAVILMKKKQWWYPLFRVNNHRPVGKEGFTIFRMTYLYGLNLTLLVINTVFFFCKPETRENSRV